MKSCLFLQYGGTPMVMLVLFVYSMDSGVLLLLVNCLVVSFSDSMYMYNGIRIELQVTHFLLLKRQTTLLNILKNNIQHTHTHTAKNILL